MTAAVWKTDEEPLVKRNRSIGGLMADSGLIYVISASGEILGRCSDVAELSRVLGKIIND